MDWLLLLKCFAITVGGGLAVYWLPSLGGLGLPVELDRSRSSETCSAVRR